MKIGFDISDLSTGRADGTTRYTYELAKRLPILAPEHEWLFFSPGDPTTTYNLVPPSEASCEGGQPTTSKLIVSPWPKYWTQLRLPWDLYKHRPDVLFMPIQQIPYLLPPRTKTVSTFHDLAVHLYPRQFRFKDWLLLHTFSAYAARHASKIIAVSRSTANDISHYYGRTKQIYTIHHGLDTSIFHLPTAEQKARQQTQIRQQYPQLLQPYILYVGQLQPRKNISGLVDAFRLISRQNPALQLAIAGGHGWLQSPILDKIAASPVKHKIHLLGVVPDDLLPALYNQARAFVLPSFYEGFGMPLLEAMACGCPVVTSNVSAMPEVVGDAAALVNPNRVEDIAAGITTALRNRDKLIDLGLIRIRKYSWDITARKTLEVLLN